MKSICKILIFLSILIYSTSLSAVTLNIGSAIDIAIKNSKELRTAKENLKSAKAEMGIARSSFFPSIEGKASYTYLGVVPSTIMGSMGYEPDPLNPLDPYRHSHSFTESQIDLARQNNWEGTITLMQPIFTWGKLAGSYKLASLKYDSEEENYKKAKIQLVYNVKDAYYSYLLTKKRIKLLEEMYEQLKETVKSAQVNYRSGIITKYDLMAMEVQLANMEPSLKQAQDGIVLAKENLRNTLGYKDNGFEVEDEFTYTNIYYNFSSVKDRFLTHNPDLKSMQNQKKIMDKLVSLSRTANKPSLAGIVNYKYTYIPEDSSTFGSSDPHSWSATLALTIPISEWFPWSRTSKEVDRSKADNNAMDLGYEQMKEGLLIQLKQIILEMNTQNKLIESQNNNVQKAKETYQFHQKQYRTGLIRNTELISSQVALSEAETNYLEAIFKYILAKAKLDLLLGQVNISGL
ncbi:MAG: TolC family protein [Spirochaetes bacterium]|nr:TolC family protein [Spirochaetota bacterium]